MGWRAADSRGWPAQRASQRGAALLLAVWMVVLLTGIASAYAFSVRTEILLTRNLLEQAQSRQLLQAGLAQAKWYLQQRDAIGEAALRELEPLRMSDGSVQIRFQDAAGLVNLNMASPDTVNDLLRYMEVEDERRPALVDALLDWRDRDSLTRLSGAEREQYQALGQPWAPRNGPLQSLDELGWIAGYDPELVERLRPLVTLYSASELVNIHYAPEFLAKQMGTELQNEGASSGIYHLNLQSELTNGVKGEALAVLKTGNKKDDIEILYWRYLTSTKGN